MILNVHIPGARDHEIGHDIWQEPLADAIRFEAENVAFYAEDSNLLASPDQAHRDELRDPIIAALTQVGDAYTAPDGVLYSLSDRYVEDLVEPLAPLIAAPAHGSLLERFDRRVACLLRPLQPAVSLGKILLELSTGPLLAVQRSLRLAALKLRRLPR